LTPQICVLDAGGQYCHLIARKVRELGVTAEVRASETPASELAACRGVIISGGPASVYEEGSPRIDPALLQAGVPVLGICYGQQLMAYFGGGRVSKGEKGEYGFAELERAGTSALFAGVPERYPVWMSHRDTVTGVPEGFAVLASTKTCAIAAMGHEASKLYGVQFHPEVVHTAHGTDVLRNFLFGIGGCAQDWNPVGQVQALEEQIRQQVGPRNVFFFVSGGVDSTVAYTLCLRALGPERVWGTFVDTGLMREGETEFVEEIFHQLGATHFSVERAAGRFLQALAGVVEPEQKRKIIGQEFVAVQEDVLQRGHFLDAEWILGQGTIYPDTIESGGTAKAEVIKTHHNRVDGIQRLLEAGRIIEPLTQFYKDEVRAVGRELGLPEEFLERHPFPGPGLGIRCLCAPVEQLPEHSAGGWILPLRTVGVQGDSRSYRAVMLFEEYPQDFAAATEAVNHSERVNRAVALVGSHALVEAMSSGPAFLTGERLDRLRRADAIVRRLSLSSGFEREVWQFPVVLVPLGTAERPDSVVLRPIQSVDGMTAAAVRMERALLDRMRDELLALPGVCAVLYDMTHKPPGTIEWE
jgi:GMP synthase (glutamine-hydrolysing)